MLVLTRKVDESITLTRHGETLGRIVVVRLADGKVRLGLAMDPHVQIIRDELLDRTPAADAACEEPFGLGLPVPYWDAEAVH